MARGTPAGELAVVEREKDPNTWPAPLAAKTLTTVGADQDPDLITAAQRLLELLDPAGAEGWCPHRQHHRHRRAAGGRAHHPRRRHTDDTRP